MVIVPGITTPALAIDFLARALRPPAHPIVLDLRGRGSSDRAETYRLVDYAGDLGGVLDALNLAEPVLFGHSLGARIVAAFAAAHPGRAAALVLVDPPLSGPGRGSYPFPLEMYLEQLGAAQDGTLSLEQLRAHAPGWTDDQHRARLESLPTCDERAVVESYRGFEEEDFLDAWKSLTDPALLVRGAESPVVPEGAVDELRNANLDAKIVTIPGAGHMVPWDATEALLAEMRRFLHGPERLNEGPAE